MPTEEGAKSGTSPWYCDSSPPAGYCFIRVGSKSTEDGTIELFFIPLSNVVLFRSECENHKIFNEISMNLTISDREIQGGCHDGSVEPREFVLNPWKNARLLIRKRLPMSPIGHGVSGHWPPPSAEGEIYWPEEVRVSARTERTFSQQKEHGEPLESDTWDETGKQPGDRCQLTIGSQSRANALFQ